MASAPPSVPVILLKGWTHLQAQLAQTLPTQLMKAHQVRRFAVGQLRKGKV